MEALASAMADGNGRVSVLDVGCNDLSLAGAAALARLIRARPLGTWEEPDEYGGPARQVLRELRLARNEVDAQACAALVSAEHAEGGSGKADGGGGGGGRGGGGRGGGREGGEPLLLTLRSLALSFNPLGDNGAAPLGRTLLRCPELHSLQLCGCAIGAAGGAALADALHAARSLTPTSTSQATSWATRARARSRARCRTRTWWSCSSRVTASPTRARARSASRSSAARAAHSACSLSAATASPTRAPSRWPRRSARHRRSAAASPCSA